MEITETEIEKLISFGKGEASTREEQEYFKSRGVEINCSAWHKIVRKKKNNDLINLYKGFVIIEGAVKWGSGSTSGAIKIYLEIDKRKLDEDKILAEFGFRNCENIYIPFGGGYNGADRSYKGYLAHKAEKERRRNIRGLHFDKKRQIADRKKLRSEAIAELRKLSFEERGKIHQELSEKYSGITAKKKLELMAAEKIYPPEYFPAEWIKVPFEELEKMPFSLITTLYDKLSTKTKGEWKRFAGELKKIEEEATYNSYNLIEIEMNARQEVDISVRQEMGGKKEYERTGVYPNYLFFSSKRLKRTWRLKVKEGIKKGSLKIKGKIVLNYRFTKKGCKVQEVNDAGVGSKWIFVDVEIALCD